MKARARRMRSATGIRRVMQAPFLSFASTCTVWIVSGALGRKCDVFAEDLALADTLPIPIEPHKLVLHPGILIPGITGNSAGPEVKFEHVIPYWPHIFPIGPAVDQTGGFVLHAEEENHPFDIRILDCHIKDDFQWV